MSKRTRSKKQVLRFSAQQDAILIDFMQNNDSLYDSRHPNYKKRQIRDKLWSEVSELTNRSGMYLPMEIYIFMYIYFIFFLFAVDDCKSRWRSLRDYAMRAKNKQSMSQVGESSGELLINRLNFLLSAAQHRRKIPNTEATMNTSESEDPISLNRAESLLNSFDMFYPSRGSSLILVEDSRSNPIADTDAELTDTGSVAASSFVTPSTSHKRKAEVEFEAIIETQNKKLEAFQAMLSNQAAQKDDLSSFFASMEGATRKLPRYLQIQIKRGLSALVFDAEEENDRAEDQDNENTNKIETKTNLIHIVENTY